MIAVHCRKCGFHINVANYRRAFARADKHIWDYHPYCATNSSVSIVAGNVVADPKGERW